MPYTKLEDNIFIINDRERQKWLQENKLSEIDGLEFELPNSKCASTAPVSCATSPKKVYEKASSNNDEEEEEKVINFNEARKEQ